MTNPVNSRLIHRYLDYQCTPEEQALVEAYLLLPEGRDLLDAVLDERLQADMEESSRAEVPSGKKDRWFRQIRERMGVDEEGTAKLRPMSRWMKAAIWAAVIGGAGWLGSQLLKTSGSSSQVVMASKQTANGSRAVVRLTDGSVIHLGAGSRLRYPEEFTGASREVFLEGEAFFEITENREQPFMVYTGEVRTTVLGTSFKVSAFNGLNASIAVATGKVRVDHVKDGRQQELAVLTPGEELNWEPVSGKRAVTAVKAADVEAWKGGRLVFHNKPISDIATELERWYGVKISFRKPGIAQQKITVTLSGAAPLEQTLQLLAAGGGFRYTVKPGQVDIQ